MKKLTKIVFALLLSVGLIGCGSQKDDTQLKVSATASPHAEILEAAKPILKENHGIDLDIEVLDSYPIFNKALDAGDVDANYFQHRPYFLNQLDEFNYNIVEAAGLHLEPFGFYSQTLESIEDLPKGATVIISNSTSDHGRILGILADAGIIALDENVDVINATEKDITENPLELKFEQVNPEFLAKAYENKEGDMVAINGNYALQAKLNPLEDAILIEEIDDTNPYVNIVACQKGKENDEKIKALIEVLKSDEIKNFIDEKYQGSVVIVE
ncbi:MAG: methionine ABC transporter substrate-binding protein [Erysipelotrichales bacterium]|nr:methionine ABC transporter substrate-binding protein [Erysipelotrichales bacterium]